MRAWFDLSTSARWSGQAVGIVRVERELGRRALTALGEQAGYCVYDQSRGSFFALPPALALRIIDGELLIRFPHDEVVKADSRPLRRRIRDAIIERPRLYRGLQRLRGHTYSLEHIAQVREAEAKAQARDARAPTERLEGLGLQPIALAADDLVISGGLDWEHKDVRQIYRMKTEMGFRYAAIIYDLIPVKFPHFVVPKYTALLRDYFGELFWLADICLSISQSTERDAAAYCVDWGVPPPPSAHFPLGADLSPHARGNMQPLPPQLADCDFAIYVSTIEPRKNHRVLYEAWDRCVRNGDVDPLRQRLVFVGRPGWNTGDLIQQIKTNPATRDSIVLLSNVSDTLLSQLYDRAQFALFPSHYEGYGLPVAEALNHGKPCICSDAGSLPEVGGDLVVYCDPDEPSAWAGAIARAFSHPASLEAQAAAIAADHKPTTWDDSAAVFFAKLVELAGTR